jgi:hypothetical protein
MATTKEPTPTEEPAPAAQEQSDPSGTAAAVGLPEEGQRQTPEQISEWNKARAYPANLNMDQGNQGEAPPA